MKHYKNNNNQIYAYEEDGSQDHLIPDSYTALTDDEVGAMSVKVLTYAQKRSKEYPSIADQLDDIYHNGINGWKATIKTTKDKYPK